MRDSKTPFVPTRHVTKGIRFVDVASSIVSTRRVVLSGSFEGTLEPRRNRYLLTRKPDPEFDTQSVDICSVL